MYQPISLYEGIIPTSLYEGMQLEAMLQLNEDILPASVHTHFQYIEIDGQLFPVKPGYPLVEMKSSPSRTNRDMVETNTARDNKHRRSGSKIKVKKSGFWQDD